jgi:class 3 adenylate cyclase
MRRLKLVDWILIGTLLPVWLLCLSLHLYAGFLNAGARLPFDVASAPAGDHPRIDRLWLGVPELDGLSPGDRILRLGEEDLRGMSAVELRARALSRARTGRGLPFVFEHDGRPLEQVVHTRGFPSSWWTGAPFAAALGLIGLLLLLRAPDWPLRRRFFAASMLMATLAIPFDSLGGWATAAWTIGSLAIAVPIGAGLTLWCAFDWTEGARPASRVQLGLACALTGLFAVAGWWSNLLPAIPALAVEDVSDATFVAFALALLVAIAATARQATPLERRQGKWIFLGFYFGILPISAAFVAGILDLPLEIQEPLIFIGRLATTAIPLGVGVSVVAYRFLDIDRLVGASATYTLLGIGLLGGAFVLVPRISERFSVALGLDPGTSQTILSMLLAAIAVPAYRAARPWVDRVLVAERFEVDRGFDGLLRELPGARDARELAQRAGESVHTLLRPESAVVYSRSGNAFEPLFARGTAIPPALPADSSLVRAFGDRSRPLVARRFAERGLRERLSMFDQAALETLASAIVVPVRFRDELVAFLSLGPKRSGDIYSPADLTLLRAVAHAVSNRLERFEDEAVAREARAMQEELRRFVPGAVARVIESEESLEPREQAVSVLFVDIRGYATFAETRAPHEIFSTVNRYTQTVSRLVEEHGGAVVEFNGDGMMVVFGAPTAIPHKERAAVSGARAIVEALSEGGGADGAKLSVGVGIATGAAYVGAVQASDRQIWTALGNTTNLAARLQALTRELDAAIVIDQATWRAAGEVAADFEPRTQVAIRGRAQREDLYLLPLSAKPAS